MKSNWVQVVVGFLGVWDDGQAGPCMGGCMGGAWGGAWVNGVVGVGGFHTPYS